MWENCHDQEEYDRICAAYPKEKTMLGKSEVEELMQLSEILDKLLTLSLLKFANNTDLHKAAASFAKKMFDAYIEEGFSREEAILLVTNFMRATQGGGGKNK
jgi:hypothetical protein